VGKWLSCPKHGQYQGTAMGNFQCPTCAAEGKPKRGGRHRKDPRKPKKK
jgi:hypothetical protein